MGFVVYQKGSAPVSTVPAVTIQKRGLLSLNRAAFDLIGAPDGAELLWDSDREIIGIRAAELISPNAYPVRPQGKGERAAKGPFLIAGSMFTQYIKLDTSVAKRWVPKLEDDVLCIDLKAPSQIASGPRGRKREEADEQPALTSAP